MTASQRAYGGRRTAQGGEVDAQTVIARSMTERDLSQHVVNLARMLGWRVARWPTFRSTATDPGVPDLVMAKGDRVYFVELKSQSGLLSDDQRAWYELITNTSHMAAPHVVMWVWRPSSWLDGTIERVLRGEAE